MWLAGRLALLWSTATGPGLAAALDAGFYFVFAAIAGREVLSSGNRNAPMVGLVLLFGVANAADHAGAAGWMIDSEAAFRAGIALVVVMISLIGGRIIPSFTRNWMARRGMTGRLPGQPTRFDIATVALTALALLGWTLVPHAAAVGWALAGCAVLQLIRLARWGGWRTMREPLVAILHIGYAWIPVGLLLLAWAILGTTIARTVAIHALTAGAMASMILAVMTRATLGHTGRELRAGGGTVAIYGLVTTGGLLRLASGVGFVDYRAGLEAAGAAWAGAFLLFLIVYGPMLFRAAPGK